jgi:hypothetical protein
MGKLEDRKHDRYEIDEPGFLRILGPPGGAFVITILDVSKGGLRIRSPRPLPEGTKVELRCRHKEVIGEVRYARGMEASEVHMGIKAERVTGMSSEVDLTLLFPDLIRR